MTYANITNKLKKLFGCMTCVYILYTYSEVNDNEILKMFAFEIFVCKFATPESLIQFRNKGFG